ncbi:MAG: putative colanic acid biosynthesis acetyltransferase WcaB [Cognaticolwellia sp.]|jgi:putative colanic acid biosynthesis acetyltransferase WcaB
MQINTLQQLLETLKLEMTENYMIKSKLVIFLFRVANYFAYKPKVTWLLTFPIFVLYIFITEWVLGIEIPIKTKIGKGFKVYHGVGLVINGYSVIGKNFTVRQGVTIGNKTLSDGSLSNSPLIGDNVELGASVIIIGEITIGHNVKIGAGTVITKSIADDKNVVGAKFRELVL